jgi:thiamine pyrophosphokinase
MDAAITRRLWNNFDFKICCDGGANRLFDGFIDDKELFIPDMVIGDLDSIRVDVKDYYR